MFLRQCTETHQERNQVGGVNSTQWDTLVVALCVNICPEFVYSLGFHWKFKWASLSLYLIFLSKNVYCFFFYCYV